MDGTPWARAQKLQAKRGDVLIAIAQLKDRQQLGAVKVDPAKIGAFCRAMKDRIADQHNEAGRSAPLHACLARPAGFEPTTPWFVGDLTQFVVLRNQ